MIENRELTDIVSSMLLTLEEAAWKLLACQHDNKISEFDIIAGDMLDVLAQIKEAVEPYTAQEPRIRLSDVCLCAIDSLNRIKRYYKVKSIQAAVRTEFELIPILHVGYIQFRFWGCAWPDEERMKRFQINELPEYEIGRRIADSEEKGIYKYDLTIMVTGFNKLDYTKRCVESLLRNLPEDISYELILLNHGSSDSTAAYFESVHPTKQIDISVNGATPCIIFEICEGKYEIDISNDTIITENAIMNLYELLKSDSQIGWAVPATSNISNLQSLPVSYTTEDELNKFVSLNNIRDIRKEERRVRLCNPITAYRPYVNLKMYREWFYSFCFNTSLHTFPDDKCSLWLRRNGYKLILAKDAYCHHFGSVTIGNQSTQNFYNEGRMEFKKEFGIDPWGTGFCYSPELFEALECDNQEPVKVLGINCGIGSNPLKVKEAIKENTGNLEVTVINYTSRPEYLPDLLGISDIAGLCESEKDLFVKLENMEFGYIIMEEGIERRPNAYLFLDKLIARLADTGILCVCFSDDAMLNNILKQKRRKVRKVHNWILFTR